VKDLPINNVRNFAVAGHTGCGKTSLVDLMLFKAGRVNRLGRVNDKTSVSDWHDEEKDKGHSFYLSALNCDWQDHHFFILDTPGSPDFSGDTTAALSVCDLALLVVDAISGLDYGFGRAWRLARSRHCPRAVFINGLDKERADFNTVLQALQEAYGATVCIPVTLPIGSEGDLSGVLNVLTAKEIPANLKEQVEHYRSALMDTVAESDEALMTRYLEGEELSEADISRGLHEAILAGHLVPVFAGSVAKDIGVAELMTGAINLFPDPLLRQQVGLADGSQLPLKGTGDAVAFVFKTVIDPFIGQLSLVRVFCGDLKVDAELHNVSRGQNERNPGMFVLNGKDQEAVTHVGPGAIVGIAKLRATHHDDTLTTGGISVKLPPIAFPKPTMSFACYAAKKGEEDKLASALHRLCEEDPTVTVERHPETHETILSGMGDQHLAVLVHRLRHHSHIEVDLRKPKVPYRETITGTGSGSFRHKKQSGGHGQFAEVHLRVEPLAEGDFEFANDTVGGSIPRNFIPAVEKGVNSAMVNGPLAACKVTKLRAVVFDGKHHAVDSSDIAFQIAARAAFREAMRNAHPILLEPIMKVAISAPDQYMGDISGDLNHRRGRILGLDREEGTQVVVAEVPVAEMHSYASQLRSITQGRGNFAMEFARYEQVPSNLAKIIQDQTQHEHDEEASAH
jgi:elongation factor G